MQTRTAIADPKRQEEVDAARFSLDIQDACNIRAIVGEWHKHLIAMGRAGLDSDELDNHPTTLMLLSKLTSLIKPSILRDSRAFDAAHRLVSGESVSYEVIPL